MKNLIAFLSAVYFLCVGAALAGETKPEGVKIAYQLPTDGPLPRTYRVTLAIVDPKNPDWLISQFAAGVARTVTAENGGKFEETWDGLDDNFMPVPPGDYGVKGIYMPAQKWAVDGEFHSVVPRFAGGAQAWLPTPEQVEKPIPFGGDPVGSAMTDVDVAGNGVAVFYYQYLENGLNNPMVDLTKPVGNAQFFKAFGSGGAAGGGSTCTDGTTVWSASTDGGPKFVYRADGKPFGTGTGAYRPHVYRPEGWVTSMACYRDEANERTIVYVAERGRILGGKSKKQYAESDDDFVDQVTILAGEDGRDLGHIAARRPRGLTARTGTLYVLQQGEKAGTWEVASAPMEAGIAKGTLTKVFDVPAGMTPGDLEIDTHGRFYLSDPEANHVYQFDKQGRTLTTYGRLNVQKSGSYDPESLMSPGKLATWRDSTGNDRLIIVEMGGPNRASEWTADGKLIREFMTMQTKANDGYGIDPDHPQDVYIAGHQGWLTRFKVDYQKHAWTVDAVWPNVGNDPFSPGFDHPRCVRVNGRLYLACGRSNNIYRLDGDKWLLSAAIIREKKECFLWHDVRGDGKVHEEDFRSNPLMLPGWVLRYHGGRWMDDLSLVTLNMSGNDVWRLAPRTFDEHGNPVFAAWEKLLTDPVFVARDKGTCDAVHGGNELDDKYSSDWGQADGTMADGFYVDARGGPNFSANEGSQYKLSRYVPDGNGGFRLVWRTGRQALEGNAKPSEVYGCIHLNKPINGLVSVIDQSRCGVLLYTTEGLYVDTVFPDSRRFTPATAGVYPQPGEFFAGVTFANKDDGKIYFGLGKFTPLVFEAQGWSLKENPARTLESVTRSVSISAAQIAQPPHVALLIRGGAGKARVAEASPAVGGASLDGSIKDWEACRAMEFGADKDQNVEVRCMYDPEHLYLRWHVRLGWKFEAKAIEPLERIFTHDRLADTVSLYLQGDPSSKVGGGSKIEGGRPGDVRVVFGIFNDGEKTRAVAVGMYPQWNAPKANPVIYRTIVGQVGFAHVGEIQDAKMAYAIDPDGKGYVLTAALPQTAFPGLPKLDSSIKTMIDFEATLGGHNKFWWANSDGSASRETYDEPTEARLYPGAWAPIAFKGIDDGLVLQHWQVIGPFGFAGLPELKYDKGRPAICATFDKTIYPPEEKVDLKASYTGDVTQTRTRQRTLKWMAVDNAEDVVRFPLLPQLSWHGYEDEGVVYMATWVYSATPTEVKFATLDGHGQHTIHGWINGEPLPALKGTKFYEGRIDTETPVKLNAGWNPILIRYGLIWGEPSLGLKIMAPAKVLWGFKVSGTPETK